MTRTLHAEWTKFRTQRGAVGALLVMCLLMVGMTALLVSQTDTDATTVAGDDDVVQNGLVGVAFAELAAVVAGSSLITAEYASGMIRTTLTATQRRFRVLVAKVVVLTLATFPLALAASAVAFVIAQELQHDRGFVAPAYPPVSITDPEAARAVAGTALLLTAYALIALGIGTVLRQPGATIAASTAIIFLPLLTLGAFPHHVRARIEQLSPLAGMAVQSTTDRMLSAFEGDPGMPIGHWTGLGVTFAWALGFLGLGYAVLRIRDTWSRRGVPPAPGTGCYARGPGGSPGGGVWQQSTTSSSSTASRARAPTPSTRMRSTSSRGASARRTPAGPGPVAAPGAARSRCRTSTSSCAATSPRRSLRR